MSPLQVRAMHGGHIMGAGGTCKLPWFGRTIGDAWIQTMTGAARVPNRCFNDGKAYR